MSDQASYIGKKYEEILKKFGDTHEGVYWPNYKDTLVRHQVMIEVLQKHLDEGKQISILDFGCGAGHFLEFLLGQKLPLSGSHEDKNLLNLGSKFKNISYAGLDIHKESIDLCKKKFPNHTFYLASVTDSEFQIPEFDYVVMNGVFTVKWDLKKNEMFNHVKATLLKVFKSCKYGLAVNFLSAHVDWQREDLFHLDFDELAQFIRQELSKKFVFRQDYGLYEYTAYIYR